MCGSGPRAGSLVTTIPPCSEEARICATLRIVGDTELRLGVRRHRRRRWDTPVSGSACRTPELSTGRPVPILGLPIGLVFGLLLLNRDGSGFWLPAVFPLTCGKVVTDRVAVFVGALVPTRIVVVRGIGTATRAFAGIGSDDL